MEACFSGNFETAQLLVDRGGNVAAISRHTGRNALHYAVMRGPLELAVLLLETGSQWDLRDNQGITPFALACGWGRLEIVQFMIEHGQVSEEVNLICWQKRQRIFFSAKGSPGRPGRGRLHSPHQGRQVRARRGGGGAAGGDGT